jgi:hypothetical protein
MTNKLKSGAGIPLAERTAILKALNGVANAHDIDPAAIAGIIDMESKWDTEAVTGSYIGLTQVGPELPKKMGISKAEFLKLSAGEQIDAYGLWLDHYKFVQKMKKHKINCLALPVPRQAAVLQAMQFAPNGEKWKKALAVGNVSVRSTASKQANALGDTSIGAMEKYYAGFFAKRPPVYT